VSSSFRLIPGMSVTAEINAGERIIWRFMRGRERDASRLRRRSTRPRINLIELSRSVTTERQGASNRDARNACLAQILSNGD
jgi:hypothetical protein